MNKHSQCFSLCTFDSFLACLCRNQVYGPYYSAQKAHNLVQTRSAKKTTGPKFELSILIYVAALSKGMRGKATSPLYEKCFNRTTTMQCLHLYLLSSQFHTNPLHQERFCSIYNIPTHLHMEYSRSRVQRCH